MQSLSRGSLRGRAGHSIILQDYVPDLFVKFVFLQQPYRYQYNRAAKTRLTETQTSRTKACSQGHMIQVPMTSSSLRYFVFGEIPNPEFHSAVHHRTGFIQTRTNRVEVKCRRTMMAASSITSSVMIFT